MTARRPAHAVTRSKRWRAGTRRNKRYARLFGTGITQAADRAKVNGDA